MQICNYQKTYFCICNKTDKAALVNGADFKVFDDAETVLAIAVPGCSEYTTQTNR
jgi:aspartyl-tRNA synthetase